LHQRLQLFEYFWILELFWRDPNQLVKYIFIAVDYMSAVSICCHKYPDRSQAIRDYFKTLGTGNCSNKGHQWLHRAQEVLLSLLQSNAWYQAPEDLFADFERHAVHAECCREIHRPLSLNQEVAQLLD